MIDVKVWFDEKYINLKLVKIDCINNNNFYSHEQDKNTLEQLYEEIKQRRDVIRTSYSRDQARHSLETYLKQKINRLEGLKSKPEDMKKFLKACHDNLAWCSSHKVYLVNILHL